MFRAILSENWPLLNPALQKHYGLREGEEIALHGVLDVRHGLFVKLLMPLIRLTGALVPVQGENFEVTVINKRIADKYYWYREFKKDRRVYQFNSVMQQYDNNLIESVGLGIGIKMGLKEINGSLLYVDKGYVLKFGEKHLPIPLHILMGKSVIKEFSQQQSENDIEMSFVVRHWLFGFMFSYMGYFNIEYILRERS